jgi:rubredoxin
MNNWECPRCGLEYDRSNEWEMSQIEGHLDKHNREAN